MNSYSQYGEDQIVQQIFGGIKGSLLDIGAWDPIDKSNSRALIELGWRAVLIEPSPAGIRNLAKEYDSNAMVEVVQAAVSVEDLRLVKLILTDDAVSAEPNTDTAKTWAHQGGYYGMAWCAAITLQDIMTQFGGFSFVNIDTEGTSVDLAIQLLATEMLPKVIIVEHNDRIVELMTVAQKRGYVARETNGTNVILERR